MSWRCVLQVLPSALAPSEARTWALATLAEHCAAAATDRTVADCLLVVSEMVTNAVRAGSASIRLELGGDTQSLTVEVFDDADGVPVVRTPDDRSPNGRGLLLVEALAAGWGVRTSITGKSVWAQLTLPAEAASHHG